MIWDLGELMRLAIKEQIEAYLPTMCPEEKKRFLERCKESLGYHE